MDFCFFLFEKLEGFLLLRLKRRVKKHGPMGRNISSFTGPNRPPPSQFLATCHRSPASHLRLICSCLPASEKSRPQSSAAAAGVGVDNTSSPLRPPICPLRNLMMAAAEALSWSDLPPELLGLVLWCLPSLADRVRVRAVYRTWRCNALLEHLPPPLPWVALFDGTFLSIPSGEIHRMPIPNGASCHGSMDNWLFFMHNNGRCSLMNPFSKAKLQLPNLTTIWLNEMIDVRYRYANSRSSLLYKLALPSSVTLTPNSLFAAFTTDSALHGTISICQPPITTYKYIKDIDDIVFFDGKLYALNRDEELFVLDIGEGHKGKPKISATRCIHVSIKDSRRFNQTYDKRCTHVYFSYLIESDGKLLHVRRHVAVPMTDEHFARAHTVWFDVFEADLTADSLKWKIVNTLEGQALFVGRCSKSLPAADCGAQEDCIYFISDYHKSKPDVDPLFDSGVFNMRNEKITPLLPETVVVQTQGGRRGRGHPTWFFPSEAM